MLVVMTLSDQLSSGRIFVLSTVLMFLLSLILHLGVFLGSTRITNIEM